MHFLIPNLMKNKIFYLIAVYLLTFCSISFSQEIYVDIVPDDYMYRNDDTYILDMNTDGIDDLEIHFVCEENWSQINLWIEGLNGAEIFYEPSVEYTGIVEFLDTIQGNLDWGPTSYLAKYYPEGNWWEAEDKYLGVRMANNGGYLYGWIRLDGPDYDQLGMKIVIKDYGYKTVLNQYVIAGLPVYYKVNNIEVSDIGDNRNGSDLLVSFEKALGDTEIVEYRMMAVKAENAGSFSLEQALLLPSDKYLSIQPSNQDIYEQTFEETSLDVDGDMITNLQPYNVFVLTYVNLPDYEGLLTNSYQDIMLKTPAEAVVNIEAEDVADFGDGRDLKVIFDKIGDETTISEYRLFVVDFSDADSFDRYAAENLSEEFYTVISPSGQNIEVILTETSQTIDGSTIGSGGYNIFVMSVTDSLQTDYSGFSGTEIITGLALPSDIMILAGQVRAEAVFVDSLINVSVSEPETDDSQDVDLNNDGINDISLSAYGWYAMAGTGTGVEINTLNNTEVVELPLDFNTPIDEMSNWGEISGHAYFSQLMYDMNFGGEWYDVGTKYLGVFIEKDNGSSIYCWVKMHASASYSASLTILNWAYVDLDGLFVKEDLMEEVKVFPNPAKDFVQIKLNSTELSDVDIEILDNTGRIVFTENLKTRNRILSERIDILKLDTGIYFLRIISGEREFLTQKLVVW